MGFTTMFDLALTFLLAAFVSAGAAFFGIAGEASEIIGALAWVFGALFAASLGVLAVSMATRHPANY